MKKYDQLTTAFLSPNGTQKWKEKAVKHVFTMKKAYLTAFMWACFATFMQAESYPIKIAGTRITSENSQNLTALGTQEGWLQGGTIDYNHATRTLTLNGAIIVNEAASDDDEANMGMAIQHTGTDSLVIMIKGDCSVTSVNSTAIENRPVSMQRPRLIITGEGQLSISGANTGKDHCGIRNGGLLIIRNTNVAVKADCGIAGSYLVFDNSTIRATGPTYGSVAEYQQLTLKNSEIMLPEGAVKGMHANEYWGNWGGIVLNDNVVTEEVHVSPSKKTEYELVVGGIQVTRRNAPDILGDGTASYDISTNTLLLKNANISNVQEPTDITAAHGAGLWNYGLDGLCISLEGDNIIKSRYSNALELGINGVESPLTVIKDKGTLTLLNEDNKNNSAGIINWGTLIIKGCSIDANGSVGIGGGTLTIDNAYITAKGEKIGSMLAFTLLELLHCKIIEPQTAQIVTYKQYEEQYYGIADGNELVKTTIKIVPETVDVKDVTNLSELAVEGIFDLEGRKLQHLKRGFNIVRMKDGSTKKTIASP